MGHTCTDFFDKDGPMTKDFLWKTNPLAWHIPVYFNMWVSPPIHSNKTTIVLLLKLQSNKTVILVLFKWHFLHSSYTQWEGGAKEPTFVQK